MNVFLRTASVALAASTIFAAGCSDNDDIPGVNGNQTNPGTGFVATALTSNQPGVAPHTDPFMVNAWGLAMDSSSFWVANNGTGRISVVAPDGAPSRIQPAGSVLDVGAPITGIVSNSTGAFKIGPSNSRGPATMLVASESGQIFGINPVISPTPQLVVDRSAVGAVYKGLTVFQTSNGAVLLAATDFRNARIDVFDANFNLTSAVVFVGANLATGLAPFNIVTIGNNVYVTYAVQNADGTDDLPGIGNGRIDVFDPSGDFLFTLLDGGNLNAPWGLVQAPADFGGIAAGFFIVGNFGDGTLLAIDPRTSIAAQLLTPENTVLRIDGLWGLMFGNGQVGASDVLYFTAGPNDETNGMFGRIDLASASPI